MVDTIADIEARGIWDADTRILEVDGKRHCVAVREHGKWRVLSLTYCNRCGEELSRSSPKGVVCIGCGELQDDRPSIAPAPGLNAFAALIVAVGVLVGCATPSIRYPSDNLMAALTEAQAYVERVTAYRSPPIADRAIVGDAHALRRKAGTFQTPGAMYLCPKAGPPGRVVLRDDLDYVNDIDDRSMLIHEAVHHGQCWTGATVSTAQHGWRRDARDWRRRLQPH